MESDGGRRGTFFKHKVLQEADILRHARAQGFRWRSSCRECCSCASSIPRCLNFCRFCIFFSASLFLAMAPWAMALTEAVVTFLLYLLIVKIGGLWDLHYSWWSTEQDVILFSWIRSLAALVSFFAGLGSNLHMPYLVVSALFAVVGLPFLTVKAIMLQRPLLSKWGTLLLACGLFSVAHVVVAMNVNLFARRRYQLGLLDQDEEQQWLLGGSRHAGHPLADICEVPASELADEHSCFINCMGLKVHYRVEQPQIEKDPQAGILLIHGFGSGAFAFRNIMAKLSQQSHCRVYALDRPGFGLTSRPLMSSRGARSISGIGNPYRLAFQAELVLQLCKLWCFDRAILIGHSDGALVALRAAAQASRGIESQGFAMLETIEEPEHEQQKAFPTGQETVASTVQTARAKIVAPSAMSQGGPSSPFSKWLQLGQPEEPQQLQAQIEQTGIETVTTSEAELSDGDEKEAAQPSLSLGSASAVLGPNRGTLSGVSTTDTSAGKGAGAVASFSGRAAASSGHAGAGEVEVIGIGLLHPCLDGKVKPQIAPVLAQSRVGRRILRRLLRSEIGEVNSRMAWHDSEQLTPAIIDLYKAPQRVQGWDAAIVEACRVRREASPAQLQQVFRATVDFPKLLVTGMHDRIASPTLLLKMADQLGGRSVQAILHGCGHLSHEEAADKLLLPLLDFASSIL